MIIPYRCCYNTTGESLKSELLSTGKANKDIFQKYDSFGQC